jgi:hypothetical protein
LSYSIDGNNVNNRIDWRHLRVDTGVSDRGVETFPGDAAVYIGVGELRPAGVVVTGFIEAATVAALDAALKAQAARMAATTLSTVAINGASYSNQHLARFEVASENIPFIDPDSGSLMQSRRVRYTWQGVKP